MSALVTSLPTPPSPTDLAALHALLRDAVEGGASVGYHVPLPDSDVTAFWSAVLAAVAEGTRVLLVARDTTGYIVGSVQLELAQKPNSRHRAEVQKLLVLRTHRGRRLGSALLAGAETAARAHCRTLLVLDTSTTGNAVNLYEHHAYTRAGVIPRYATDPDGPLIDTAIYYKHLPAQIALRSPSAVSITLS